MPENTTSTGTVGLLNESLGEASGHATEVSVRATTLLETFDRLADETFGTVGPLDMSYWEIQSIRLGLEALGDSADLMRSYVHDAEEHAEGLAELVKVVERLRGA